MCKYKLLLTIVEIFYIVARLNGTDFRFVDYNY